MNKLQNRNFEWIIHVLVWVAMFSLPTAFVLSSGRGFGDLFLHFWTQLIALAILFYLNYFFLVKLWLYRDKQLFYVLINLLLLFTFSMGRDLLIDVFSVAPQGRGGRGNKQKPPFGFRFYIDFLIYLIPIAFAFAIQSGKRMLHIEALKKEADSIKLQSELQHLKFQLQPHFFFNALNNIYSSIDIDPGQAKTAIHSLSKLMRYFLQKSEEEKVSLADELDFLNKYIDLMKMRLTDKTSVSVHFPEIIPEVSIPPLVLISLVENAFKHGVSASQPSKIDIGLSVDERQVNFTTFNTSFPKQSDDRSGSGIGLKNLEKRLQLLYPKNHRFETKLINNIFTVNLAIPIREEK